MSNIFLKIEMDGCPNCGGRYFAMSYVSGFMRPVMEGTGKTIENKSEAITCMNCKWEQDVHMVITTTPGLDKRRKEGLKIERHYTRPLLEEGQHE